MKRKHSRSLFKVFFSGTVIFAMFMPGDISSYLAAASATDQSLKQITKDHAPDYHMKWSPDGKRIAFASKRAGNLDIWVKNVKARERDTASDDKDHN